jgi:hypothetical protein
MGEYVAPQVVILDLHIRDLEGHADEEGEVEKIPIVGLGSAASGVAENTIVIFTSDNGGERYADTWPFTGRKTELLEGGLRIPAVIRWPGHIPRNTASEEVTIGMDWFPTLLAAAGTAPDRAFPPDGINLLPCLSQGGALVPRKLFWRYKHNDQQAARDGDRKYLKILDNTIRKVSRAASLGRSSRTISAPRRTTESSGRVARIASSTSRRRSLPK